MNDIKKVKKAMKLIKADGYSTTTVSVEHKMLGAKPHDCGETVERWLTKMETRDLEQILNFLD